jgi:hypothetical protein
MIFFWKTEKLIKMSMIEKFEKRDFIGNFNYKDMETYLNQSAKKKLKLGNARLK